MTEDEATRIAGHLIARTQGWDEPSITAWIDDLTTLANPDAALTAVNLTLQQPGLIGRPHWGDYRQRYLTEIRRRQLEQPALGPARHELVSLATHLERLTARASHNPDAADELATWRRLAHTDALDLVPKQWHRTLATLTRTEQGDT